MSTDFVMDEDGYLTAGRPTWDEFGLEMAKTASLRADCTRRKVGAALMLPDHSVVVTGYNGGPSKGPSCLKGECPRGRLGYSEMPADAPYDTGGGTCVALHAEWNVLLRATWEQMMGATLYVTEEPCHVCKNLIAGTGIREVVWPEDSWRVSSEDILKKKEETITQEDWATKHPNNDYWVVTHADGTQRKATSEEIFSGEW